jgi:hypothetical protein
MTGETENEIIVAGKELHEIIAAAKELGIKLTNAKPGTELWEEACDPAKHAKLCVDDGRTDECKAVIEDANALIADAAPALPSASETSATAATTHSITLSARLWAAMPLKRLQGRSLAAFSEQV